MPRSNLAATWSPMNTVWALITWTDVAPTVYQTIPISIAYAAIRLGFSSTGESKSKLCPRSSSFIFLDSVTPWNADASITSNYTLPYLSLAILARQRKPVPNEKWKDELGKAYLKSLINIWIGRWQEGTTAKFILWIIQFSGLSTICS